MVLHHGATSEVRADMRKKQTLIFNLWLSAFYVQSTGSKTRIASLISAVCIIYYFMREDNSDKKAARAFYLKLNITKHKSYTGEEDKITNQSGARPWARGGARGKDL